MALEVKNPSDIELAFPVGKYTPPLESIPEEFQQFHHPTVKFIMGFWYEGSWKKFRAVPRPGINPHHAFRMIQETLGTWSISHEHKEAAAAYMLTEFFEKWWEEK